MAEAIKRFNQLTTQASRADWVATTFFAVDSATTGTKKLAADILVKILDNLASEFNAGVDCEVNHLYWREGVLYRCKTAHSGAWGTGSDFEEASIDELFARKDVVAALQSAMTAAQSDITGLLTKTYNLSAMTANLSQVTTGQGGIRYSLGDRFVGTIVSTGQWSTSVSYTGTSYFIEVFGSEKEKIKANASKAAAYSFVKDTNLVSGDYPNYATGYSDAIYVTANTETSEIEVPEDARYMYILANGNNTEQDSSLPEKILVNTYEVISGEFVGESIISRVSSLEDKVGNYDPEPIDIPVVMSSPVQGAAKKTMLVGSLIDENSFSTSASYSHREFSCAGGEKYKIHTKCYGAGSGNYKYFIHVVNASNYVTAVYADLANDVSDFIVETVAGDAKIIISDFESAENNTSFALKVAKPSIEQNFEIVNARVDEQAKNLTQSSKEVYVSDYNDKQSYKSECAIFEMVAGSTENGFISDAMTKVTAHNSPRCLNFALITDTHQGSTYLAQDNKSPFRSVEALKKILGNSLVDFGVHCGDVSTSYGASHDQYGKRLCYSMGLYLNADKPLFIAKGNHDAVNNGGDPDKVEADLANLDWDNNNYYVVQKGTLSTFVQVTEDEFDGVSVLYTIGSRSGKLFSDKEFFKLSNGWIGTSVIYDADNQKGCYYYKDFDDYKVRVIVLNAEQVNDAHEFCTDDTVGPQLQWLSKVALDLSDKETPSDWHVVTIQHISIDNYIESGTRLIKTAFLNIIGAFMAGSNLSGSYNGYDYSFDFSVQGEGNYIGNIHGHEHQYTSTMDNGFNDIGFTIAARKMSTLGTKANYGLDVITIDTANRTIYDTVVGTEYNGNTQADRTFTW